MKKSRSTLRSGLKVMVGGALLVGAGLPLISASAGASSVTTIKIWYSGGDQSQEVNAINYAVKSYNKIYAGKYQAVATAVDNISTTMEDTPASQMPDLAEGDGPTLSFYAWSKKIQPIGNYVNAANVKDQTGPVLAQDTYQGKLYGMAVINGTLALYANKTLLKDAGITACTSAATTASCYPTNWADAWTGAQLAQVLAKLQGTKAVSSVDGGYPMEANLGYGGEYPTYAFLPLVNSAGSPIIKNNSANVLNTTAVKNALGQMASWAKYIDPSTATGEGQNFAAGKAAFLYGGHWQVPTIEAGAVWKGGSNVVALPLPNMGDGAKDGSGSNNWVMGADSKKQVAAGKFLDLITEPKFVDLYTWGDGNTNTNTVGGQKVAEYGDGAVPASKVALAQDPLYKKGGLLYSAGLAEANTCSTGITKSCIAVPRPVTPGYPAITSAMATLFDSVLTAGITKSQIASDLNQAISAINENYATYDNYQN